jgi:hypothetical protein
VLIVGFLTGWKSFNIETEYNITLNECHNETVADYYPLNYFYHVECQNGTNTINMVKCYDKNGNEIIGAQCLEKGIRYECLKMERVYFNYSIWILDTYTDYIFPISFLSYFKNNSYSDFPNADSNYFHYNFLNEHGIYSSPYWDNGIVKNVKVSQVCNTKNVTEIILEKEGLRYVRTIDKKSSSKQLDKEWLGSNCECEQWCDYEFYRKPLCFNLIEESWEDRDRIDNLICSKYSCGDYTVEVLK